MPLGVAFGQIVTMDDHVADALAEVADGSAAAPTEPFIGACLGEHFERRFYLYKRTGEPCHVCGSGVRTQLIGGRNLFWCGRCQRRRCWRALTTGQLAAGCWLLVLNPVAETALAH